MSLHIKFTCEIKQTNYIPSFRSFLRNSSKIKSETPLTPPKCIFIINSSHKDLTLFDSLLSCINWFKPFDNITNSLAIGTLAAYQAFVGPVPVGTAPPAGTWTAATGGDTDATEYLAIRPGDEDVVPTNTILTPTEIP